MDGEDRAASQLAHMARELLAEESVQGTLDKIVTWAVDLIDGCEDAGILVVEDKRVRTLAAKAELVLASDRLQEEVGEGPCFDADRYTRQIYRIEDVTQVGERWKRYTPRARELGIGSIMGFSLYTEGDDLGALNLYSTRPGAFTERSEHIGWQLASHAAVALSSAHTGAQFDAAMVSRHDIGEAIGVVMERYKIPEDRAFAMLKKSSQDRNIKLRDIARTLCETGEILGTK